MSVSSSVPSLLPSSVDVIPCELASVCCAAVPSDAFTFNSADIPCVCTSWDFQQAAARCLKANCPPSDYDAAMALQALECTACEYCWNTIEVD